MSRRVVVTAMGFITSMGNTEETVMERFQEDRVNFQFDDAFRDVLVCPVPDFHLNQYTGRLKNRRYLNRGAGFCLAAAILAAQNSMMTDVQRSQAGLFSGTGPNFDLGEAFPGFSQNEPEASSLQALWMLRFLPNTASSIIAEVLGIHGENATISTACSASLQAIGEAYRRIRDGYLDIALAGGGDSRLNRGGILAYRKAQALHEGSSDPGTSYASFDSRRNGFVPGEGGAFFVLEELSCAKKRKAQIVTEVCGYGCSMDGFSMTAPEPDGIWAEKAVCHAMKEAGVEPAQIDLVTSHGTGTLLNDRMEAALIRRVFSGKQPYVISLKSWIGHLAAACGAVEMAITLLCMKNDFIPKIRNLKQPCDADIHLVRENGQAQLNLSMIQSFGFGGQNSALVIRKWKD
ncbi:MAG: beta-ketoacyl-[acyl-carrier-protein] synthase family protein [Desulfobacteraceae bacterium]|nr:MAG: beta-ketoacyl-[acyl-carrier-protein] synthase family protein [Desulfobacteraceae bacterium]